MGLPPEAVVEDYDWIPQEWDEYCSEVCYDIQKEHDGFCEGDECIDYDCYWKCIQDFMKDP